MRLRLALGLLLSLSALVGCDGPFESFPNAEPVSAETRVHALALTSATSAIEGKRAALAASTAQSNWKALHPDLGGTVYEPRNRLFVYRFDTTLQDSVDEWRAWSDNVNWPAQATDGVPSRLTVNILNDRLEAALAAEGDLSASLTSECSPNINQRGFLRATPRWPAIEGCWRATLTNSEAIAALDALTEAAEAVLAETN